jgi:hypothetical protein
MVEFGQVNRGVLLINVILFLAVVDVDVEVSADWERVLLLLLSRTFHWGICIHPRAGGLRRAQKSIEQLVTTIGMRANRGKNADLACRCITSR